VTVRVEPEREIVELLVRRVSPVPVTRIELPSGSVTVELFALIVMVMLPPYFSDPGVDA
jgi:hypothetical protein